MSRGLSMLNDWCGLLFRFRHHIAVVADVEKADRDIKTALLRLRPKTVVKKNAYKSADTAVHSV